MSFGIGLWLAHFSAQGRIGATPVKHVVLSGMGDRLGLLKGALVNYVVSRWWVFRVVAAVAQPEPEPATAAA